MFDFSSQTMHCENFDANSVCWFHVVMSWMMLMTVWLSSSYKHEWRRIFACVVCFFRAMLIKLCLWHHLRVTAGLAQAESSPSKSLIFVEHGIRFVCRRARMGTNKRSHQHEVGMTNISHAYEECALLTRKSKRTCNPTLYNCFPCDWAVGLGSQKIVTPSWNHHVSFCPACGLAFNCTDVNISIINAATNHTLFLEISRVWKIKRVGKKEKDGKGGRGRG